MPRGDKSAYSDKQKRQAEHIEENVRERGGSEEDAERIGWATVNKETVVRGRKKTAKKSTRKSPAKKTTRKSAAGKSAARKPTASKSTARKSPAKKTARRSTRKTAPKSSSR